MRGKYGFGLTFTLKHITLRVMLGLDTAMASFLNHKAVVRAESALISIVVLDSTLLLITEGAC